jgi:hypothetical protein
VIHILQQDIHVARGPLVDQANHSRGFFGVVLDIRRWKGHGDVDGQL